MLRKINLMKLLLLLTLTSMCLSTNYRIQPYVLNDKYWVFGGNIWLQRVNPDLVYLTNKGPTYNMVLNKNAVYSSYEGFSANLAEDVSTATDFKDCKAENKCVVTKGDTPETVSVRGKSFKADKAVTRFQWSKIQTPEADIKDFSFYMLQNVDE